MRDLLGAICRKSARSRRCAAWLAVAMLASWHHVTAASSLRFFGNGVNDIDRVKIQIDNPADNNPGPPADVGNTDFTIEFWAIATNDNNAGSISCGANNNWITGNIVVDRDRYNQGQEYGVSLGNGRVAFGTSNASQSERTICGTTDIRDGQWHHIAVQRRRSDGRMWLWVDGALEAEQDGPDGDISYPDNGVPNSLCGPSGTASCNFSDPFIVIGAEKHDADPVVYPSFRGWVDELRISTVLRYSNPFTPSAQAFVADANTAGLYHFDEATGNSIGDSAFSSLSPGVRRFGGNPAGPQWATETPFSAGGNAGTIRFSSPSYSINENGSSVTITVTRVGGSTGAVTVNYATSNGSATAGADYQSAMGTLSWANGDTAPKTFSISVIDDSVFEGNETVNLSLSNVTGGASLGSPSSATLTIQDNEVAMPGQIQLSAAAYSAGEAAGGATIVVRRVGGSDGAVTVNFSTSSGTATAGSDFVAASGVLSWANGDAGNKSFVIQILDDSDVEGNETANITISAPTGGAVLGSPASAQLTITDDDFAQPGVLSLSSLNYSVGESEGTVTITVNRTGGNGGAASVDYNVNSASAQAGIDFAQSSGTLNWAAGEDSPRSFDIVIIDDSTLEGDETATIALSNVVGANPGSVLTATLTIVDDESASAGSIQLSSATASVNEASGSVIITATRIGGTSGTVTIDYSTSSGTALANSDFQPVSGTLSWSNGNASAQSFAVPIVNDVVTEPNETFTVTLSNVTGGAIAGVPASATVTIFDDDIFMPGTLQFTSASYTVSEGAGVATISVSRSGGADGAISVDYVVNSGTALPGSDYLAANGTLTWPDGDAMSRSLSITIVDDTLAESPESLQISLQNPQGGASLGSANVATLTITDNDNLPPPAPTKSGGGAADMLTLLGALLCLAVRRRRYAI